MGFECDLCGIPFEDGDVFVEENLCRIESIDEMGFVTNTLPVPEFSARICLDCAEDR